MFISIYKRTVCASVCVCVWRSEFDHEYRPQSLSALFMEAGVSHKHMQFGEQLVQLASLFRDSVPAFCAADDSLALRKVLEVCLISWKPNRKVL